MSLKIIFALLFLFLLVYSVVRPFSSIFSKSFLIVGSTLGLLSISDFARVNYVASFLGIDGGGKDLFLYVSFITIFLVIFYVSERFRRLETRIAALTRRLALESVEKNRVAKKLDQD